MYVDHRMSNFKHIQYLCDYAQLRIAHAHQASRFSLLARLWSKSEASMLYIPIYEELRIIQVSKNKSPSYNCARISINPSIILNNDQHSGIHTCNLSLSSWQFPHSQNAQAQALAQVLLPRSSQYSSSRSRYHHLYQHLIAMIRQIMVTPKLCP